MTKLMAKQYIKCGACNELVDYEKSVEIQVIYPSQSYNICKIYCTCETCAKAVEQIINKHE